MVEVKKDDVEDWVAKARCFRKYQLMVAVVMLIWNSDGVGRRGSPVADRVHMSS